jgi:hypothetical protein
MTRHQRATFTRGGEVIEHAVQYLKGIRDVLDDLRGENHGDRVAMFLNVIEVQERELIGALERFLDDVPDKVLDTYAQYTIELPAEFAPLPDSPTTLDLTQWVARYNGALQETFAELGDTGEPGEIADVFAGIAAQIQSHERRLSKEYQRFEDL